MRPGAVATVYYNSRRYADWHPNTHRNGVHDLRGKTLEEVGREAARIRLGDHFSLIGQFDRCLHTWRVLNGKMGENQTTRSKPNGIFL